MLAIQAMAGILFLLCTLALALFWPAGTLDYREAWTLLWVFGGGVLGITLYLLRKDQALLKRRLRSGALAETDPVQKVIQALTGPLFLAIFSMSALGHRHGWAPTPGTVCALGDVLVAAGLFVVFLVFRENSFTSATIGVEAGQQVVDTGPYALVRHPMYAGAVILLIGVPPALGSLAGCLPVAPLVLLMALRALREEAMLRGNLPGYAAYLTRVRWRFAPHVW